MEGGREGEGWRERTRKMENDKKRVIDREKEGGREIEIKDIDRECVSLRKRKREREGEKDR